ncbi:PEGA domain-containing protein [Vibrio lentus]|uniref:PEGA domain-containing protein n=1 Tax=Vibrio TaxID=662 RepID=UPI0002E6402E|nr:MULTISPECIES: PEGA domain-containing protein [Vibrio]OCH51494.1 chromosome partitioning protein ParA [Vibrio lentus]PMI56564.1 chromosome partitioning protein ParA [Vibrio lentus]
MTNFRISALLLALSPLWVSASVSAEELNQVDPVSAIDAKLTEKNSDIERISATRVSATENLKQLQNKNSKLLREGEELKAKRNRAKSVLDKQYSRLLEDPETDLVSFQKSYQDAWAAVKENQSSQLDNQQAMNEGEIHLSQIKQKQARLNNELANLRESKVEARVKRIATELRESAVLETSYTTTCASTMTLGECTSQGKHLTNQKAVQTFKTQLLEQLTESTLAKQNLQGVQDSQAIKSGFSGNNAYFMQIQAQLQAKPEAIAACNLLNVSTRYCLTGSQAAVVKKNDKQWANVTVRSDQYNDSVTINGIKYGSTPIEVALPSGRHQVTISKQGYESYNRSVTINGSDTIWVKLLPSKES